MHANPNEGARSPGDGMRLEKGGQATRSLQGFLCLTEKGAAYRKVCGVEQLEAVAYVVRRCCLLFTLLRRLLSRKGTV